METGFVLKLLFKLVGAKLAYSRKLACRLGVILINGTLYI